MVRDGWGYSEERKGNAVLLGDTPNNDFYLENYPWTLLKCTGNAVGLPEGTQGGSEPGHLTMGAGRIVWQPLEAINRSIREGGFWRNQALVGAVKYVKRTGGSLHLGGLLSDQGIHGTIHHLFALLELARRHRLRRVYIHCFLDGRDVPERSAIGFIEATQRKIRELGVGRIASLVGRYYAMDRDENWGRTKRAYDLLTLGEGLKALDPVQAVQDQYEENPELTDYYLEPVAITDHLGQPVATLRDGDAFIHWNFRSDRARQLTYALTQKDFPHFHRRAFPKIHYVCMSVYDKKLELPVAYPQERVKNNLGQVLSRRGVQQLRIAETEKYAHVTYFFNSQVETPYPGEHRILVPSPKVPSYEEKPEMSAYEITEKLLPEISKRVYGFILVNYANGDLVGHSANLEAGIKAVEVVDECLGRVVEESLKNGYTVLVTGDHGNIECMFYPDGSPNPSHGFNPVPLILISNEDRLKRAKLRKGGGLKDIAPTILGLMGLNQPPEMTGVNLVCDPR